MKVYVAGKVTGLEAIEVRKNFIRAEVNLRDKGHLVITPRGIMDCEGFEHDDYMHICYAMIDVCDAVYMLRNWKDSKGARMELGYAREWHKKIMWEDEATKE